MARPKVKDLNFHFHCGLGMGSILGFLLGMLFIILFVDDNLRRVNQFWDEQLANQTDNMKHDIQDINQTKLEIEDANTMITKANELYEDAREQDKIAKDKAKMMGVIEKRWEKTHGN